MTQKTKKTYEVTEKDWRAFKCSKCGRDFKAVSAPENMVCAVCRMENAPTTEKPTRPEQPSENTINMPMPVDMLTGRAKYDEARFMVLELSPHVLCEFFVQNQERAIQCTKGFPDTVELVGIEQIHNGNYMACFYDKSFDVVLEGQPIPQMYELVFTAYAFQYDIKDMPVAGKG